MENKKTCFKCLQEKTLSEYYVHKQMSDGHLNKCKDCTKKDTSERVAKKLLENPEDWINKERIRSREKSRRLNYNEKYKSSNKESYAQSKRYNDRYPEKTECKRLVASARSKKILDSPKNGCDHHHWSYNKNHALDVIEIERKKHNKIHIYLIYDQERFMYRRYDTNELLDTKEKHESFIRWAIDNLPD